MRATVNRIAALAAAVVATAAMSAVIAGSAHGYGFAGVGYFNPTGATYVEEGTLTFQRGAQTATCDASWSHTIIGINIVAPCSNGGTFRFQGWETPLNNASSGGPKVRFQSLIAPAFTPFNSSPILPSMTALADVTNGDASTPTTYAFAPQTIGTVDGVPVTLSGEVTITTSTGGLVTVDP